MSKLPITPPASRREFVVLASTGLLLGLAGPLGAQEKETVHYQGHPFGAGAFDPASVPDEALVRRFLAIDPDGGVTVYAKHLDMGQGIWSGLASIVAEELDADWEQVRILGAPARMPDYANHFFNDQATGGSTSLANSWDELRRAGALARAMLVNAAARAWGVAPERVTVRKGVLACPGHEAGFGAFASQAASVPLPTNVQPKARRDWTLLGTDAPRRDVRAKVTGAQRYGIDGAPGEDWQGLRHAVIARPPRIGARVARFEADAALACPGVEAVIEIPSGIAVIAGKTWQALKGRAALEVQWSEDGGETRAHTGIERDYRTAMDTLAPTYQDTRGDLAGAFARAATRLHADFTFPYLAHAPMEPLALRGRLAGGACYMRGGFQAQGRDQRLAAKALGLEPERVHLETVMAGGSFGRRAAFDSDWVVEMAHLLGATKGRWPLQITWTREDDLAGAHFRPLMVYTLHGGLDAAGNLLALDQRMAGQSATGASPYPPGNFHDRTVLEGTLHELYDVPHSRLVYTRPPSKVPVATYRSISNNHTGLAKEIFIDRLARAAKADPVAFRLALLRPEPRQAAVLRLAAQKAGWDRPATPGITRGVAVHRSEGSCVAQVAELSGTAQDFRIERIVSAVDCGPAVNPDTVRAQVEGGTVFGLSSGLYGEITLDAGRVEQTNFDRYRVMRMHEAPRRIEVHLTEGTERPSGIGEPGSVPGTPAVVNALERMGLPPVARFPVFPG